MIVLLFPAWAKHGLICSITFYPPSGSVSLPPAPAVSQDPAKGSTFISCRSSLVPAVAEILLYRFGGQVKGNSLKSESSVVHLWRLVHNPHYYQHSQPCLVSICSLSPYSVLPKFPQRTGQRVLILCFPPSFISRSTARRSCASSASAPTARADPPYSPLAAILVAASIHSQFYTAVHRIFLSFRTYLH